MQSSAQRVETTLTAYGATVSLCLPDAGMLERVTDRLPRAWRVLSGSARARAETMSFTVLSDEHGYLIQDPTRLQTRVSDAGLVPGMLRTMLRRVVGANIDAITCVEASVVTHRGRGIMVPALALSGASTLTRALVTAGAELHSEDLALIDLDGRAVSDLDLGSAAGAAGAVPIGLVALLVYRPGAGWAPRSLTPAEGVVALMGNVLGRQERPAEVLATLRLALGEATLLQGERDEADAAAAALLTQPSETR